MFWPDDEADWMGRGGFVVGSTEHTVAVLGGHAPGEVPVIQVRRDRIEGLRWPAATNTAGQVKAEGSRMIAQADGAARDAAVGGGVMATPPVAEPG